MPVMVMSQFNAGVSQVNITGPIGSTMYGYGARGSALSTGVHDSLYARTLILSDGRVKVALVTLDMGAIYATSTRRIRKGLSEKLGLNHLMLIASHSHSTPTNLENFPSEGDPWLKEIERRITRSIIDANQNLQPAFIASSKGEVNEGFNRRLVKVNGEVTMMWRNEERIPTSPLDYELGVIHIKTKDKSLATLVNFACHPVVLGPDNLEYSADYPGAVSRKVSEAIGGQVMYLPGAQGDINPFEDKQPVEQGGFEQVDRLGSEIAKEVQRLIGRMVHYESNLEMFVRKEVIDLAKRQDVNRIHRDVPAEISTLLVGNNLAFGFFPGEFFVEHGLSLKSRSPIENTFFVGYTNDHLTYFPTIQATTEGGYGAATRTFVEVGAGERLVNRVLINLLYLAGKISP